MMIAPWIATAATAVFAGCTMMLGDILKPMCMAAGIRHTQKAGNPDPHWNPHPLKESWTEREECRPRAARDG